MKAKTIRFHHKVSEFKIVRFVITMLLLFATYTNVAQKKDCPNGGIEDPNFSNWLGFEGTFDPVTQLNDVNSGITFNSVALPAGTIQVVNAGQDVNVPSIQRVMYGNNAIMLGSDSNGGTASRVVYDVLVNNANSNLMYNYAFVLQNPPATHDPEERPFFWARILHQGNVICETGRLMAGMNDPLTQQNDNFTFRDWDCQVCDLSNFIGQTVQVEFTVSGCSFVQHFGYAYIDGLCEEQAINVDYIIDSEQYCRNDNIYIDGTPTVGETYYYLTIEESDENMGRPNPSSEVILYFPNANVDDNINITQLFENNGFNFQCNQYYRLKLAAGNDCSPWNEVVKLIHITCPPANAGNDVCVQCKSPTYSIQLGDNTAPSALQYSWSPSIGLNNPNIKNPYHTTNSVTYPFTYTLTVTDKNGCTNTDTVTLVCKIKPILSKSQDCCGLILTVTNASSFTSIQWSNGSSGNSTSVTTAGVYSVTVSGPCGIVTNSITVTAADISNISRYYTNLNDASVQSYYSSGSNQNSYNAFYIMHVEDPQPAYGEYYATQYKLDIFNKWGVLIRTIEGQIQDCKGFDNPAIFWDGTVNGNMVQDDVYEGKLYLKNCRHQNWVSVNVHHCNQWGYTCDAYDCFFLPGPNCGTLTHEECVDWSNFHCVQEIVVNTFPITILN